MPFSSLFSRKVSRKTNSTKGKPQEGFKAQEQNSDGAREEDGVVGNCTVENGDVRDLLEADAKTSAVIKNSEELPQDIRTKETGHEVVLEKKVDELCADLQSPENSDNRGGTSQHEDNCSVGTKGIELDFNTANTSSIHYSDIYESQSEKQQSENRKGVLERESKAECLSICSKENVVLQEKTAEGKPAEPSEPQIHSNENHNEFSKMPECHKDGVIESDVIVTCSEDCDDTDVVDASKSSGFESDLLTSKDEANEYGTLEIVNPDCAAISHSEKPNEPFRDLSETNVLEGKTDETKNHGKDTNAHSVVREKEMDERNGESVLPAEQDPFDDAIAEDPSSDDQNKLEINGENPRSEDLCEIKEDNEKTNEIQPNVAKERESNTGISDQNDDSVTDMDCQSIDKMRRDTHPVNPFSDVAEIQIKSESLLEGKECSTSSKLHKRIEEHGTGSSEMESADVVSLLRDEANSSVVSKADSIKHGTEIQVSHEEDFTDEKQAGQVNTEDSNLRTQINPDIMKSKDDHFCKQSGDLMACLTAPSEDSSQCNSAENDDFLALPSKAPLIEQHHVPSWKVGNLQVKLPSKSRGRGKLKAWRQRWVVFQMDEFVKDAKDPSLMISIYASECSTARNHSALFWSTVSASKTVLYRSQSRTHKYAFSISVDGDVIVHLAADSETASQEWMAAIRNLLWPQNQVLQLEKMLHGSEFEVSVIDNDFSFHAGLLGAYGDMKINSNKLILRHPQTEHVIQEWYLNTLDKFQLLQQNKEEDAYKVVVMHTGQDSSTGSGQIVLFCPEAVAMLQSIASTIHKFLQYRTTAGKEQHQQELADLAEWLNPVMSRAPSGEPTEDYYKVPRRQIRSLLDIPNFAFEKPLAFEDHPQVHEDSSRKSVLMTSSTSASTFSHDSGISLATQSDDFLNCSVTSFTIGGLPVRSHTSSESSDGYSPPSTPEPQRKQNQEPEET